MDQDWTQGYFTQMPYTIGYYREMSPSWLRFCLLLAGIEPPRLFDCCELAMGMGYSANLHAAANEGRFMGLDFMPDHALYAGRMAEDAGTGLRVCGEALEDFGEAGEYDCVCLHGGWSWLAESAREALLEFLRRRLRPGGLFYLSYNCWPGQSTTAPLRKLFALFDEFYGSRGQGAPERIGNALNLTGALLQSQPLFLNSSPWIAEKFQQLQKESPAYLAHEYFDADWHVEWFADLAARLWQARLSFGASAQICANIPGFGLTEPARRFLGGIADAALREQLRDFFCNSQFRADIFVKGALRAQNPSALLAGERVILCRDPAPMSYEIECGMGRYALDRDLHQSLLEALAADNFAARTIGDLHESLGGKIGFLPLCHALARLMAKGYVAPCKALPGRREHCARFNALVLRQGLAWLASPQTGAGLEIPPGNEWLASRFNQGQGEIPQSSLAAILKAHGVI